MAGLGDMNMESLRALMEGYRTAGQMQSERLGRRQRAWQGLGSAFEGANKHIFDMLGQQKEQEGVMGLQAKRGEQEMEQIGARGEADIALERERQKGPGIELQATQSFLEGLDPQQKSLFEWYWRMQRPVSGAGADTTFDAFDWLFGKTTLLNNLIPSDEMGQKDYSKVPWDRFKSAMLATAMQSFGKNSSKYRAIADNIDSWIEMYKAIIGTGGPPPGGDKITEEVDRTLDWGGASPETKGGESPPIMELGPGAVLPSGIGEAGPETITAEKRQKIYDVINKLKPRITDQYGEGQALQSAKMVADNQNATPEELDRMFNIVMEMARKYGAR